MTPDLIYQTIFDEKSDFICEKPVLLRPEKSKYWIINWLYYGSSDKKLFIFF